MFPISLIPLALALGVPPQPVVQQHAIRVTLSSVDGEAEFFVPVSSLAEQRVGRKIYSLPGVVAFLAPDGFTPIGVLEALQVEYTGDSLIRLQFSVYAGNAGTTFNIRTGNLVRGSLGGDRGLTRASLFHNDANGDGGGVSGLFRPELLPVELFYSYRAFINDPIPFSQSFASLLSPIFTLDGTVDVTQARQPSDGDLALFFVPVEHFSSGFAFRVSGLDQARGASTYFITHGSRCGPADVATIGGDDLPDGLLTADDIIVYLDMFFNGDIFADLVGPGGVDITDGELTPDDLIAFLGAFFAGCPH